jgi:hypothetical protein
MKNIKIILTIITVLFSQINFAQVGVEMPIQTLSTDVANGTYIKDINNSFIPFIGNWQGSWNGKTITFFITKVTKNIHSCTNGDYNFEDRLIAKYNIVDNSTGVELENTTSIIDFDDQKIFNIGYVKDGKLSMFFLDKSLCNYGGEIYLRQFPSSPDHMNYGFMFDRDYRLPENCNYSSISSIPIPIPTVSLLLTRI